MALAIKEAEKAFQKAEVPIGAVLGSATGEILAKSHNQTIRLADPTAHAEILVIRAAAKKLGNYRLLNTTLYVTVEPCVMCMGAVIHARIAGVVFGAPDPKWGAVGSLYDLAVDDRLNHQPDVIRDVCKENCKTLMQIFFRAKRSKTNLTNFSGN